MPKDEAKEVERPPKAKTKVKERAEKVKEKLWEMSKLRRSQKLRSRPGPGMPVDGKVMVNPVGTTGPKADRAQAEGNYLSRCIAPFFHCD